MMAKKRALEDLNAREAGVVLLVAVGALSLTACGAFGVAGDPDPGEDWPSGAIEHIVPLPAGGGTDTVSQLMNAPLEDELGVSVNTVVRDGGAGATAVNHMLNQPADGHTIMLSPNDLITMGPVGNPDVAYDPEEDLQPVARVTADPWVMLASIDSGIQSIDDVVDRAREDPGALTIGISTVMDSAHYAFLLMERQLDFPGFTYVTYGGGGPYMQAVYAGEVDLVLHLEASIDEELVTPLMILDPDRMESYPEVPTSDDAGFEGLYAGLWQGIFVHPDTDPQLVSVIEERILATVEGDSFQQAAQDADINVSPMGLGEFEELIETERGLAQEVVDFVAEAEIEEGEAPD